MELVIEIVTRNEKVLNFHKLSGERISIGRAYDNDLVLQEEHVCPKHAEVIQDEQGRLVLSDLSSINGIKDKHNRPLPQQVEIRSGDVFVIGKIHIRILSPEHPVIEAKKLNIIEDLARNANHWYLALSVAIVFFFWHLLDTYLSAYQEFIWPKMAVKSLILTIGIAVIPLVVALAARIFKKDVKFFTIVVFSFINLMLWQLFSTLGSLFLFNWGGSSLVHYGGQLIEYMVLGLFLWGSFYLASNMSLKKISVISSGLVIVIATLVYFNDKGDDKVVLSPVFLAKVLPSSLLIAEPLKVEEYVITTDKLFVLAKKEADRRNKEADD